MEQDIAAQVVGLGGASDFSLWSLFMRADFIVKFVIILLIASSIFSWALIFDKLKLFKAINKSTEDFEKKFWKAKSAESFNNNLPVNSSDPATLIFKAAMSELIKTKRQSTAVQTARVERILEIATDTEIKTSVEDIISQIQLDKLEVRRADVTWNQTINPDVSATPNGTAHN